VDFAPTSDPVQEASPLALSEIQDNGPRQIVVLPYRRGALAAVLAKVLNFRKRLAIWGNENRGCAWSRVV